jgi:hypothetical protein
VPIAHDAFHIMKRANKAINEIRKDTFFRAGPTMRAIGRGTRWLVARPWNKCSPQQQGELERILSCNKQLARAYQIGGELREVLRAPDRESMEIGLGRILRRTPGCGVTSTCAACTTRSGIRAKASSP